MSTPIVRPMLRPRLRPSLVLSLATACCLFTTGPVLAQADGPPDACTDVGGMLMTNFIDADTTLGVATGDLKGAVSADLLGVAQGPDNTTIFTVQHHWTTESGDTIGVQVAHATARQVAPGLFAILSYPVPLRGGTGRFAAAAGLVQAFGEVDLNTQRTVFRYAGRLCRGTLR